MIPANKIVPAAKGWDAMGFARNKLAELDRIRRNQNSPYLREIYAILGFTITVVSSDTGNKISITGGTAGFLFYPHSNSPKPVAYPLVDDDGGTRRVYLDADDVTWEFDATPPENYGNIDWKGLNSAGKDEPSDAAILTFRGPPGRCIPLPDTTSEIKGFTFKDDLITDPMSGLPVQHYTVFSEAIYEAGEKIAAAPGRVLGAAYKVDGTLVCIVWNRYDEFNPWKITVNPDGGAKGFYFEYWELLEKGWTRKAYIRGGRPLTPFFFNGSGTKATSVQGATVYRFDGTVFTTANAVSGNYTVSTSNSSTQGARPDVSKLIVSYDKNSPPGVPGQANDVDNTTVNITRNASQILCVDYLEDKEVVQTATLASTGTDIVGHTRYSKYALIPVYDDPLPVSIGCAPIPAKVGSTISVGGGFPPYSLNVQGATVSHVGGGNWVVTALTGCVPGSLAMITATASDCTGATGINVFRKMGGSWTAVSSWNPYPTANPGNISCASPPGGGYTAGILGLGSNYCKNCYTSETSFTEICVSCYFVKRVRISDGVTVTTADPPFGPPGMLCVGTRSWDAPAIGYESTYVDTFSTFIVRYVVHEYRCP